jgi:hypothetical protein
LWRDGRRTLPCGTHREYGNGRWKKGRECRSPFHTLMGLKRCVLVVEHLRYRGVRAGKSDPVFFYVEKQHGIGDDSGGILLVAEIDLALDALPGGGIKVETFRKGIVSQCAILSSSLV